MIPDFFARRGLVRHHSTDRNRIPDDACFLDFSSDLLPEQFTVTFLDEGRGADDWLLVGSPTQK